MPSAHINAKVFYNHLPFTMPVDTLPLMAKANAVAVLVCLLIVGSTRFDWGKRASVIMLTKYSHDRIQPATLLEQEILPAELLFAVVSSDQSVADWLLHEVLQQSPEICSPLSPNLLDPDISRVMASSQRPECSYAWLLENIQAMASNAENTTAGNSPCRKTDIAMGPGSRSSASILCRWIDRLEGDHSEDAIVKLWMQSYSSGDSDLLPCVCDALVRGVKVASEWLPRWPHQPWDPPLTNMNVTQLSGSKIIYIQRKNLFARYLHDHKYGRDQISSGEESKTESTINTEDMLGEFYWMRQFDERGKSWVNDHASDMLTVEYSECRENLNNCIAKVSQFLGVKAYSIGEESVQAWNNGLELDRILNKEEVAEALAANDAVIAEMNESHYQPIHLLVYEPDPLVVQTNRFSGVEQVLFGAGNSTSKSEAALAILRDYSPDQIVVIGENAREIYSSSLYAPLSEFRNAMITMITNHPGAIIASASHTCCRNAMTHFEPGSLFAEKEVRSNRVCNSNDLTGCKWKGNDRALVWQEFMKNLAVNRGFNSTAVYLDAGLLAGTAADLANVLEIADVEAYEDSTAVLTDLMFHNSDLIMLDYNQEMFGSFRIAPLKESIASASCSIPEAKDIQPSIIMSKQKPLFMQRHDCIFQERQTKFPVWRGEGIHLDPIIDHIKRVANHQVELVGVDLTFGRELPYFIDKNGLWVSRAIRNETPADILFWRNAPIETVKLFSLALIEKSDHADTRWRALHKALKSGGVPYFAWYGDFKNCNDKNYNGTESIPMFTNSATIGCASAFPSPSYQEYFDARPDRWRSMFHEYDAKFPWETKTRKIVWRGSLSTNNPARVFDSVRWRLCEAVHQSQNDLFDVGLTRIPEHNHKAEQNLTQVGGLASHISPMENFQMYSAILDMDGNSWSSRFGTLLCYNSLIIKVEPHWVDYFFFDLKPWTHYIPVKNDLSDLFEIAAYVMDPSNEAVIKDIIASANQWCAEWYNPIHMALDMADLWESYVRRMNLADPNWVEKWQLYKNELLNSPELDFARL